MYKNARLSVIKWVSDQISVIAPGGDVKYLDLDNNSDIQDWPQEDIIGVSGIGLVDDEGFHDLTFGVTIITMNDENNFRLTDYVDHFYRKMAHGETFDLYSTLTNAPAGTIVMQTGTSATPAGRAEMRNVVTIVGRAQLIPAP